MTQVYADSFAPREFESWHHIAITGYHDDDIDKLSEGQPGDIQPDSKINAFLLDVGNQIMGDKWTCLLHQRLCYSRFST